MKIKLQVKTAQPRQALSVLNSCVRLVHTFSTTNTTTHSIIIITFFNRSILNPSPAQCASSYIPPNIGKLRLALTYQVQHTFYFTETICRAIIYGLAKSIEAAAVVATGATPLLHTQAYGAAVWLERGGPLVHHELACHAVVVVLGAWPAAKVPLMRMGMIAPVLNPKTR